MRAQPALRYEYPLHTPRRTPGTRYQEPQVQPRYTCTKIDDSRSITRKPPPPYGSWHMSTRVYTCITPTVTHPPTNLLHSTYLESTPLSRNTTNIRTIICNQKHPTIWGHSSGTPITFSTTRRRAQTQSDTATYGIYGRGLSKAAAYIELCVVPLFGRYSARKFILFNRKWVRYV